MVRHELHNLVRHELHNRFIQNEPNIYSLIEIILKENLVNEINHKENIYINNKIKDDMFQWWPCLKYGLGI